MMTNDHPEDFDDYRELTEEEQRELQEVLQKDGIQAACLICQEIYPLEEVDIVWLYLPSPEFDFVPEDMLDEDRCAAFPVCREDAPEEDPNLDFGESQVYEAPYEETKRYFEKFAQ